MKGEELSRPTPALTMWVVYDHPTDHPNDYVARRWTVQADGMFWPDTIAFIASSLETLRATLRQCGLSALCRAAHDDPAIVESWL